MEELAKLAGGKGNVVILIGDPANEAAVLRTQGCKDVAAKTRHEGHRGAGRQLGARGGPRDHGELAPVRPDEIDVVCANNDEMALGAIKALKAANKLERRPRRRRRRHPDALAAMKAGDLEVTVFQDADGQGGGGIDAAVKLANGETVATDGGVVDVPYVLVDPGEHGRLPVTPTRRLRGREPDAAPRRTVDA